MKLKKIFLIPGIVAVCLIVILFIILKKNGNGKTTYTFAEVTRGDIENTVNATGTIEPVTTVEVGTQVSGIIDKIYVDFNDRVTRNQLMAVIDTTILSVQVRDARANLLRSQAQYDEAKYNFEKTEKLYKQGLLSELEYITAKSSYQSALSSMMSSQNNLERAERNMRYAFIRSPINGTVIYREVEEGQTVASSFQTPRLFLIAEDLSKMEIHALVDESEIGLIKVGQPVRFDVQAYDEKVFTGTVRQVWLQPEEVQNVVNYTVVVDADNPEGLLLPGMTATLDFIIEHKKDVLLVPVAATKLQPTEEMMQIVFANMKKRFGSRPDSASSEFRGGQPLAGFGSGTRQTSEGGTSRQNMGTDFMQRMMSRGTMAIIWFFDENKELQSLPVRTGSTDGKNIEIIPLRGSIEPGLQVIESIVSAQPAASQNNRQMGGFRRGPF